MKLNLDLALASDLPRLLTQARSSGPHAGAGPETASSLGQGDSYDWKAATLAILRAQQSAAKAEEPPAPSPSTETRIENPAAANEAAIFLRYEILNQITTALRAHATVTQLPLAPLMGPDLFLGDRDRR